MQAVASFKRPEKPITIYEFDACPFCKKVREMVCYLDLDVLFYPCPQGGPNFRPEAVAKGGKSRFPYMEDPNTGAAMYESDDIIKYLADNYGDGTVPLALRLGAATAITAGLSGIGRCASLPSITTTVLHLLSRREACSVLSSSKHNKPQPSQQPVHPTLSSSQCSTPQHVSIDVDVSEFCQDTIAAT